MSQITNLEQLESIYGQPAEASVAKVANEIGPSYRKLIEASPFLTLATAGENGLDCSPRGDEAGFVRVVDSKTLQLPDRRGNNRVDSLRNIINDPHVAMLFFYPGSGISLRVNGTAAISVERDLLESFASHGQLPRTVLVIDVDKVYF